jgi:hypothetical protein
MDKGGTPTGEGIIIARLAWNIVTEACPLDSPLCEFSLTTRVGGVSDKDKRV